MNSHRSDVRNGSAFGMRSRCARRGQSLVEFALVALVMYMILAAILTFGHALYVAQGLQQAADLGAREISRTPLPANMNFDDAANLPDENIGGAIHHSKVRLRIFDDALLVIDLNEFYANFPVNPPDEPNIFRDLVPTLPLLNQQLVTMMIADRPDFDGDGVSDAWLLRYPGALLRRTTDITPPVNADTASATSPYLSALEYKSWIATDYVVGIPVVSSRTIDGVESIRWVPIVEEIDTEPTPTENSGTNPDPFSLASNQRGIVALRINFPFQSASMSSFRHDEAAADYPFEATIGRPYAADDGGVVELSPGDRPGDLTGTPLEGPEVYAGTYGGQYGLGAQGALGSQAMTGGRPVRPYRRVISAQAIYRREVFER
jgi:hypothetical protein